MRKQSRETLVFVFKGLSLGED